MKTLIYINRHKVKSNKKWNRDEPCIAIRTYKGIEYARSVDLLGTWTLKQDFEKPICSGATIWLEGQYENLVREEVS